jgi:hypothetical protein
MPGQSVGLQIYHRGIKLDESSRKTYSFQDSNSGYLSTTKGKYVQSKTQNAPAVIKGPSSWEMERSTYLTRQGPSRIFTSLVSERGRDGMSVDQDHAKG